MKIENSEKAITLLKAKANIKNVLTYIKEHKGRTVIISVKSKTCRINMYFLMMRALMKLLRHFVIWKNDLIPN